MNKKEIKTQFNNLRERYGELLIKLKREKVLSNKWYEHIFKQFNENELLFLFGKNIWNIIDNKNIILDLGKGTKVNIENNSSKLLISPEKAGIITWICTDGYMSLHRGYYISIKDSDILIFNHFKNLIEKVYGKVHFGISKVKDKNAFQCRFCSKAIFRDLITYIPLSTSKEWTIPIEILDKKSKKEVLRVLTHTEGCTYQSNRNRVIEITLANLEVLMQAKSLFQEFKINTRDIRKDYSNGWKRYKLSIGGRSNLEKFRKIIGFIPNTKKYEKFEKIVNSYKEYHRQNNSYSGILFDTIKKNKLHLTKDLIKISGLERSSVSRNLRKLKEVGAIDYKKGKGNSRYWFVIYN